jgi:HD-like signal output (HDOD) protein/ActR/RegA family two-component response regulator
VKSILFVDDEPEILEGLERMLRPQRAQWNMSFATGGEEALAALAAKPADVVVTDMRMPGMDGARLLEIVRQRHPGVVRIVLSGYSEMKACIRAVQVAHQFLAKPCEPTALRQAIERSCALAGVLPDQTIRRVVGAIGRLPALPRTSASLAEALADPEVPFGKIGGIIERDVGITAKLLQLVNSAFFCLSHRVTSVRMAVQYLGLDTLERLVLTAEIFRSFPLARAIAGFSLDGLQEHSQAAARIAAKLPAPPPIVADAVIAALLHDTGKLVLASRLPREFEQALVMSRKEGLPVFQAEERIAGANHAQIGAYLLGLWGLPDRIVDAVCRHHRPALAEGSEAGLDVLAITHIADALALEAALETPGEAPAGSTLLNLPYLTQLGVTPKLSDWRALARQLLLEAA